MDDVMMNLSLHDQGEGRAGHLRDRVPQRAAVERLVLDAYAAHGHGTREMGRVSPVMTMAGNAVPCAPTRVVSTIIARAKRLLFAGSPRGRPRVGCNRAAARRLPALRIIPSSSMQKKCPGRAGAP
jgi:hypothetical protein